MNNRLSYCGLVDAKIRASDKDLPVTCSDSWMRMVSGCCSFSISESSELMSRECDLEVSGIFSVSPFSKNCATIDFRLDGVMVTVGSSEEG